MPTISAVRLPLKPCSVDDPAAATVRASVGSHRWNYTDVGTAKVRHGRAGRQRAEPARPGPRSAFSWVAVPMAISTSPGSITVVGRRVGAERRRPARRMASTRAPGGVAEVGVAERPARPPASRGHRELVEPELEAAVVHDDVEEVGDVGLGDQRRHAGAADGLRVHDPVGAGLERAAPRRSRPGPGRR